MDEHTGGWCPPKLELGDFQTSEQVSTSDRGGWKITIPIIVDDVLILGPPQKRFPARLSPNPDDFPNEWGNVGNRHGTRSTAGPLLRLWKEVVETELRKLPEQTHGAWRRYLEKASPQQLVALVVPAWEKYMGRNLPDAREYAQQRGRASKLRNLALLLWLRKAWENRKLVTTFAVAAMIGVAAWSDKPAERICEWHPVTHMHNFDEPVGEDIKLRSNVNSVTGMPAYVYEEEFCSSDTTQRLWPSSGRTRPLQLHANGEWQVLVHKKK